ncbi:hypothetical protein EEL31_11725 [Brevibacillus laterosporus]|uniref:Uncharacterized protein n=1 Tax=Brevibacillus laterosporus TaxID=1465 RepID=A0A518VE23_BRELA|nr:hypothetical protein [Brevibacillus laterosporus]QDX95222.1 hypothetical protein EEL30_24745 [Brevibacillus laterosporus]RAP26867.1 hypothetical protein C2W64_01308 [Brevibacillus laterosporus]TPG69136.1 hypothetical protein EEL31_11725 [Brevibacillus laterosporus]
MDVFMDFQTKLLATMASHSKDLAAFHFYLEEENVLSSSVKLQYCGELTLIWQDGSISLHVITPALLDQSELPLAKWAAYRFFRSDYRYLVDRDTIYKSPTIYDPLLAEHVKTHTLPELPEGFTATASLLKRTYGDSRHIQIFEQETRLHLHPTFNSPFSYQFRRLPPKAAREYLQTEAFWFNSFTPSQIPFYSPTKHTICLLSPTALQRLLLPCFLSPDFQMECRKHPFSFSGFEALYDPKRLSGIGSRSFDRRGRPLSTFSLSTNLNSEKKYTQLHLLPDLPEDEIALGLVAQANTQVAFHPWLQSQPEVLFIPTLDIPNYYHPLQTEHLFCPQATLFRYGKPVLLSSWLFPVSGLTLFLSKSLISVRKPVWDVPGLAFPALSLESTS